MAYSKKWCVLYENRTLCHKLNHNVGQICARSSFVPDYVTEAKAFLVEMGVAIYIYIYNLTEPINTIVFHGYAEDPETTVMHL